MKILFVDDEPAILRTIRRTLRNLPDTDRLDLEGDPLAALRRLRETDYDLVVTDMRMPGCNGVQVLQEAARCNPGGLRAVLSGYSGEAEMAEVVPYAHLIIGKPFDPKAITDLIERASALAEMPLPDGLRRRLGGLRALPPLPHLFTHLTKALEEDQSSSLTDICALLNQDMALVAKIMQLANSAFFAGRTQVVRIEQAVQMLGIRLLSSLVLQHEMFVNSPQNPNLLSWRERLNREGLKTAAAAMRIARHRQMSTAEREESTMGSLLHDIGRLVLAAEFQDHPDRGTLLEGGSGIQLCNEEIRIAGAHHGWVGAYLMRLWGLPQPLVQAVAWHHHPSRSGIEGFTTLTVVHVADIIAHGAPGAEAHLDLDYLSEVGCLDDIPVWMELIGSSTSDSAVGH
ncbi:HDOD domain-containing protein [Imhoffiella purpurea]|uniref:Response regulator n=1 Tax=Imhoffiella purpurea TaxID=1249627 RepID=W9VHN0_9GAMM|nr:HDOD domain-containing protein [Imhoffiella purpurea]EXJ15557.1 response regulator [Imhoffiella purpurea]